MTNPAPRGAFVSGPLVCHDAALFTDLYELTMAASYVRERMTGTATFSLFVRKLPAGRAFLVAAGLADALAYLRDFRFSEAALAYLGTLGGFDDAVLAALRAVRFTGNVRALPEGTVFFADEPLLEITAPILEAQLVEMKDEGDRIRRKMRYRPKPVIKSVGPKNIPPEWFAFIEESTWDKKKRELTFRNVPTSNSISSMLVNTGVLKLRDAGGGQTERQMSGEINIKVPFLLKPLGMVAEKIIQAEGVKLLDADHPVLQRFVNEVVRSKA